METLYPPERTKHNKVKEKENKSPIIFVGPRQRITIDEIVHYTKSTSRKRKSFLKKYLMKTKKEKKVEEEQGVRRV